MSSVPPASPGHIGVILDGNGRWAASRGLPRVEGHRSGARNVRVVVDGCLARGIRYLTLYTFSVANWSRPKDEVDGLMDVAQGFAEQELERFRREGVRVELIGEPDEVRTSTRRAMERLCAETAGGDRLVLTLALNYGGRRDMVNAIRTIAAQARAGLVVPEDVTERSLRRFLTTSRVPDPDLVIRTGGENRLSDFLLFEAAYAELFFTDVLWPDFTDADLSKALAAYHRRQRRFGKTGEQVAPAHAP